MKLGDLASGGLLVIGGAAVAWHASGFPRMPGHLYGAGLFPVAVGCGLAICGGLLAARGTVSDGLRGIAIADWVASRRNGLAALVAIATPVLFIGLLESVGFLALATASLLALFLVIGVSPLRSLASAIIASLISYWLFAKLLRVPLPRGITAFLGF